MLAGVALGLWRQRRRQVELAAKQPDDEDALADASAPDASAPEASARSNRTAKERLKSVAGLVRGEQQTLLPEVQAATTAAKNGVYQVLIVMNNVSDGDKSQRAATVDAQGFEMWWESAEVARLKLQSIGELNGGESADGDPSRRARREVYDDPPTLWADLMNLVKTEAGIVQESLDALFEHASNHLEEPSQTGRGTNTDRARLAGASRRAVAKLAYEASQELQLFLDVAMVAVDDAADGAVARSRAERQSAERVSANAERQSRVPALALERLAPDSRDSRLLGLTYKADDERGSKLEYSMLDGGRLEDFGPLSDGQAMKLAFTADDVGKSVRIKGVSVVVDGLARTVNWHGFQPPQVRGKIAEVTEAENGAVRLRDGTAFPNMYTTLVRRNSGPGRNRERKSQGQGACNQTRAKLALKQKLRRISEGSRMPSPSRLSACDGSAQPPALPAPSRLPAPSPAVARVKERISVRRDTLKDASEWSALGDASYDASSRSEGLSETSARLSMMRTRSGEFDMETFAKVSAPKIRRGQVEKEATSGEQRRLRWRKAVVRTLMRERQGKEGTTAVCNAAQERACRSKYGLSSSSNAASKKMTASRASRNLAKEAPEAPPSPMQLPPPQTTAPKTQRAEAAMGPKRKLRMAITATVAKQTEESAAAASNEGRQDGVVHARVRQSLFMLKFAPRDQNNRPVLPMAERKMIRRMRNPDGASTSRASVTGRGSVTDRPSVAGRVSGAGGGRSAEARRNTSASPSAAEQPEPAVQFL